MAYKCNKFILLYIFYSSPVFFYSERFFRRIIFIFSFCKEAIHSLVPSVLQLSSTIKLKLSSVLRKNAMHALFYIFATIANGEYDRVFKQNNFIDYFSKFIFCLKKKIQFLRKYFVFTLLHKTEIQYLFCTIIQLF